MCVMHLKDKKANDFMLIFDSNETIDVAMANSVLWYDHVLKREDSCVLRSALDI